MLQQVHMSCSTGACQEHRFNTVETASHSKASVVIVLSSWNLVCTHLEPQQGRTTSGTVKLTVPHTCGSTEPATHTRPESARHAVQPATIGKEISDTPTFQSRRGSRPMGRGRCGMQKKSGATSSILPSSDLCAGRGGRNSHLEQTRLTWQ